MKTAWFNSLHPKCKLYHVVQVDIIVSISWYIADLSIVILCITSIFYFVIKLFVIKSNKNKKNRYFLKNCFMNELFTLEKQWRKNSIALIEILIENKSEFSRSIIILL